MEGDLRHGFRGLGSDLVSLVQEFVRLPTVNRPPNGEESLGQRLLCDRCRETGLEVESYELDDVPEFRDHPERLDREFRGRFNVLARWKGSGGGRSLLFSGHMDVVPPDPLPWNLHEPFDPAVEERRLYGRGAADMKGGLVAAFHAIRSLKESGFCPRGDVLLESVVDEEYAGTHGTLAARLRGDRADFAIVPEPTEMAVCPASYGARLARISVSGPAGIPYGENKVYNPVFGLGKVIGALKDFEEHWNRVSPDHPLFQDSRLNAIIYKVLAGDPNPDGQMTAPAEAWLSVILQTRPGTSEKQIDVELSDFLKKRLANDEMAPPDPPCIINEFRYMPATEMEPDHPGVQTLVEAGAAVGQTLPVRGAPYSCDLFLFHRFGIPAVLFGPRGGHYHGKDEWVDLDDLTRLSGVLVEMIRRWCG